MATSTAQCERSVTQSRPETERPLWFGFAPVGRPYDYKPALQVNYSDSGPRGCGADACTGPALQSTVVIPDPTLDGGGVAGTGQVTFTANPGFIWDEGGPPLTRVVHYAPLFCQAGGGNSDSNQDAGGGFCRL